MYCFISKKSGKFIGMDYHSGGYPYETDYPLSVKLWNTKEEAIKYARSEIENWTLMKFNGLDLSDVC